MLRALVDVMVEADRLAKTRSEGSYTNFVYWFLNLYNYCVASSSTTTPPVIEFRYGNRWPFSILYHFCIVLHPTNTHFSIHWIYPNQWYQWVYVYFLIYWAVGMSKFTTFPHMINLSIMSLFSQFFFVFIDLQTYSSLIIQFIFCMKI